MHNGEFEHVDLAPENHPGLLQLPQLVPPGVLVGRGPTRGVSICGIETISFGKHPSIVAQDLGTKSIRSTINLDVTSFARLIAKIGYGFAVAELGLLPREHVPILPLILGDADDASFWLGSAEFRLAVEAKSPMHAAGIEWISDPVDSSARLLLARIKLFASSGATGYEVVVCREISNTKI